MKTTQITLLDELHQRSKALALASIEAHVIRVAVTTPPQGTDQVRS